MMAPDNVFTANSPGNGVHERDQCRVRTARRHLVHGGDSCEKK